MIPYRDLQKRRSFPFFTLLFILVNSLLFFYESSLSLKELTSFLNDYGFVPARFEPLDLGTSLFLHGSWLHLIINMLYLWVFGDNVEEKMGLRNYLLFYLLAGIASSLTHYFIDPHSSLPLVGASGAISGILGLYLRLFPKARVGVLVPIFFFFRRLIMPAWAVLTFWFAIQLLEGYFSLTQHGSDKGGVAFFAHIGGFVFGLLIGPLFVKKKKKRS